MSNNIYDDKNNYEYDTFRPNYLKDYIGQDKIKDQLSIYVSAAKLRCESLDHVLLYGPPGLGKTTLAKIIANELGYNIIFSSGPMIEKPGDIAAILSSIKPGDILFIDEIHRVPKICEEMLYSAMEDFKLNIIIGKDEAKKIINLDIPPFTLVGATTKYGDLSAPLRDRFGVIFRLDYYNIPDLKKICYRLSKVYNTNIDEKSANLISQVSRGTPRILTKIFKRIRDFSCVNNNSTIDYNLTNMALKSLNITKDGLTDIDLKYLLSLKNNFKGGPCGIENLAISIQEDILTVSDVYEPYLIKNGYIVRTLRGRKLTQKGYDFLLNITEKE